LRWKPQLFLQCSTSAPIAIVGYAFLEMSLWIWSRAKGLAAKASGHEGSRVDDWTSCLCTELRINYRKSVFDFWNLCHKIDSYLMTHCRYPMLWQWGTWIRTPHIRRFVAPSSPCYSHIIWILQHMEHSGSSRSGTCWRCCDGGRNDNSCIAGAHEVNSWAHPFCWLSSWAATSTFKTTRRLW